MKEHLCKLIKHTTDELNDTLINFANNSKLIMASLVHNYSDAKNYPCLDSSLISEGNFDALFDIAKKFENDTPSNPTPWIDSTNIFSCLVTPV